MKKRIPTAEELRRKYVTEHPDWPWQDWQYDVAQGDTKLGYWDWVQHNVECRCHRNEED